MKYTNAQRFYLARNLKLPKRRAWPWTVFVAGMAVLLIVGAAVSYWVLWPIYTI